MMYTLVIGAIPGNYHVGWLAGSVTTHLISCELNGKTFWFCPQRKRGMLEEHKDIFDELVGKIESGKVGVGERFKDIGLSEFGYFYDGAEKKILWRFKLEKVLSGVYFKHNKEQIKRYEPFFSFRRKYLEDYGENKLKNHSWFLISDIRRLKMPFVRVSAGHRKYAIKGFKVYTDNKETELHTYDFMHGGPVFVHMIPRIEDKDTELVTSEQEADTYLKQFFLNKPPDRNLRELAIQQAFAVYLMKERKNWTLRIEEPIDGGRPDIIFEAVNGDIIAVEIKRDDNDTSVDQLSRYVDGLQERYKNKTVKGIVVCGKARDSLKEKAKDKFEILEYRLSITFHKVLT